MIFMCRNEIRSLDLPLPSYTVECVGTIRDLILNIIMLVFSSPLSSSNCAVLDTVINLS